MCRAVGEIRASTEKRKGRVIIWGWCLLLGKRKNRVVQPGFSNCWCMGCAPLLDGEVSHLSSAPIGAQDMPRKAIIALNIVPVKDEFSVNGVRGGSGRGQARGSGEALSRAVEGAAGEGSGLFLGGG